jgi:hypothetical protein
VTTKNSKTKKSRAIFVSSVRSVRFVGLASVVSFVVPLCVAAAGTQGPRGGFGGPRRGAAAVEPNVPYDGRFTFARLRYGPAVQYVSQRIPWSHDYPSGERHFMKIMNELTYLRPHMDESDIIGFDDPDLFKHPVAYMAEPGFLALTDEEAAAFRAYLQKGGFVIFDDFSPWRGGWDSFEAQMLRVLPGVRFVDLDATHPIFHSFFEIDDLDIVPQYYDAGKPIFRGIFEDNDPNKRLLAMVNFNTDISEYWEFSDTGLKPIDESNEAYKLGVNYIVYGMLH